MRDESRFLDVFGRAATGALDVCGVGFQNDAMAMMPDPFPATHRTWMNLQLAGGDAQRASALAHIMTVYVGPLCAYFERTRFRTLGDATEVVHGFFADRLERTDYLTRWQQSGLPLRRWLANGLLLYAQEVARRNRRDSRAGELPDDLSVLTAPEQTLDRAFARSVARLAMEQAAEACRARNLGNHWRMFIGHNHEGMTYRELGEQIGVPPERAAVMARTASHRFRNAVGDILTRDGVPPERLQSAIAELLESLR